MMVVMVMIMMIVMIVMMMMIMMMVMIVRMVLTVTVKMVLTMMVMMTVMAKPFKHLDTQPLNIPEPSALRLKTMDLQPRGAGAALGQWSTTRVVVAHPINLSFKNILDAGAGPGRAPGVGA